MKYLLSVFAVIALVGCDNRNTPGTAERSEVDRNDRAELAPPRSDDDSTTTREVVEAPGQVGKVEQEKGSATVEGTKTRITTETDKVRESVPTVGITHHRADINRMNEDDFVALGMTRDSAEKVTEYREKNGDFRSIDDLRKVPGFSSSWFTKMKDKLAVSSG